MTERLKENRVQFAVRRGVSPGQVSKWISRGVLSGDAVEGEGIHRRVVVEIAEAQLAQRKLEDVRPDARRIGGDGAASAGEAASTRAMGRNVATAVGAPMHGGEGMPRTDDRALVRICLTHGGFPRIFVLDGKVFWLDAAGAQWTYGRAPTMRGVAR